MKFWKIIIIGWGIVFTGSLAAQNVEVYYEQKYRPDSTETEHFEKKLMKLSIRGKNSIFYSNTFSRFLTHPEISGENAVDPSSINLFYIIAKKGRRIIHYAPINSEFYQYEDKNIPEWEIKEKIRTIDSLSVRKATTRYRGRDWVAWYTPEISIPEGPYKFKGLPGLILEIASKDGDYEFIFRGIERSKEDINTPEAIELKDRAAYLKQVKQYAENPGRMLKQERMVEDFDYDVYVEGQKVNPSEEARLYNKFVWEFMKTHNNPIEKDDIWIR